jgi:hypothetical protein
MSSFLPRKRDKYSRSGTFQVFCQGNVLSITARENFYFSVARNFYFPVARNFYFQGVSCKGISKRFLFANPE